MKQQVFLVEIRGNHSICINNDWHVSGITELYFFGEKLILKKGKWFSIELVFLLTEHILYPL